MAAPEAPLSVTAGGLVIAGRQVLVPGLRCVSWLDDPSLRLQIADHPDGQRDGSPRRAGMWIRAITLHTTRGIPGGSDHRPQIVRQGLGPSTDAGRRDVHWWSTPGVQAGSALVIDFDGTVYCTCDLSTEVSFHAPPISDVSIGIEIAQGSDAELYEGQLAAVVTLVDFLTRVFGIQRQIPSSYRNRPVDRLARGGTNVVGVYGHRDVSASRGCGDPGDAIFQRLSLAGYEQWDLDAGQDLDAWRARQGRLGVRAVDGIPGPGTIAALRAAGKTTGLWVARPGDDGPALVS